MKEVKEQAETQYPVKLKADTNAFTALGKGLASFQKPIESQLIHNVNY